jgi:hypothetical protein
MKRRLGNREAVGGNAGLANLIEEIRIVQLLYAAIAKSDISKAGLCREKPKVCSNRNMA